MNSRAEMYAKRKYNQPSLASLSAAVVEQFYGKTKKRFWSHVKKTDECWIWTGTTNGYGYGIFYLGGKLGGKTCHRLIASRVSWEIENGTIPDGIVVCHKCDRPSCVRPDHLFLGTDADNMRDRKSKGRYPKGEECLSAKFKESDIIEMRRLRSEGMKLAQLAEKFNIDQQYVSLICRKKVWSHI